MIDAKDVNDANGVVDAVDHAVLASPGDALAHKLARQGFANSVGVVS